MPSKIITDKGVICFEEKIFSNDKKPLDIEVATKILVLIKNILDENGVSFGLIFGTLLGAVREKDFIKHDQDIDLYVLEENKRLLLNSIPDFIDAGFEVGRYDGKTLTVLKDGEYIDFYIFRKHKYFYRKCDVGLIAKSKYLENTIDYLFLGEYFKIPKEKERLLVDLYGKNWRIPKKNDPSMNHNNYIILRNFIKKNIPYLYNLVHNIKSKII